MDPVELRRINLIREFPYRTPVGFEYDSGDYERCMDRALELARPERADGPGRASAPGSPSTSSGPAACSKPRR